MIWLLVAIAAVNAWYWLHERPRMTRADVEEERRCMRIWLALAAVLLASPALADPVDCISANGLPANCGYTDMKWLLTGTYTHVTEGRGKQIFDTEEACWQAAEDDKDVDILVCQRAIVHKRGNQ